MGTEADWECVIFTDAIAGESPDPVPEGALLVNTASKYNVDCTGKCTSTEHPDWEFVGGDDGLSPSDTTGDHPKIWYCAKSADGTCSVAYEAAKWSHPADTCVPKLSTANGEKRLHVDVTWSTDAEATDATFAPKFGLAFVRGFGDDYDCDQLVGDKCQVVESCGAYHAVHNARVPQSGECSAECNAAVGVCTGFVCFKDDSGACKIAERLTSSSVKPAECAIYNPPTSAAVCSGEVGGYTYMAAFIDISWANFAQIMSDAAYCCQETGTTNSAAAGASSTTSAPSTVAPSIGGPSSSDASTVVFSSLLLAPIVAGLNVALGH